MSDLTQAEIANLVLNGLRLLFDVVKLIPTDPAKQSTNDVEALKLANAAYYATEKHYDPETPVGDRPSPLDLAQQWEEVAILLKDRDPQLSKRIRAKSEYWRSGGNWTAEKIQESEIQLEGIKKEIDLRIYD